jgi:hypothetical protein
MKNVSRAILLMFFAALALPAAAANLAGIVRNATAETATVELTGDVLPAVGDKVEIFFDTAPLADFRIPSPSPSSTALAAAETPSGKLSPGSGLTNSTTLPSTTLPTPALKPVPLPTDGPDDAIPGAHYAAIAYSPATGKWGSARHYKSKYAAMAHARSESGQIDAPASWCRNGWVALAISDQQPGVFGSTWGGTANAVREAAKRECLKRSSDARVVLCISSSSK